ncbi:MAG: hypothetical protein Q9221_002782 [Calogaya cf. arnoldii]
MGNTSSHPSSAISLPEMSLTMGKPSPTQRARRRLCKATAQRTESERVRSPGRISKRREKARSARLGDLPSEVILGMMKWMKLGRSRELTIIKGIQSQQYPDFHKLFGTVGEEKEDEKWYVSAEKEDREWWLREDNRRNGGGTGHEGWSGQSWNSLHPLPTEFVGRIRFFVALAEDIEKTAAALKEEGCITDDAGSEGVTRRALLLFRKMQWIDRPGLEHLCSQDDTVFEYMELRRGYFDDETAEVRIRFQEIMRFLGSRVWKRLEMWDWTREWSTMQQYMGRQYIGEEVEMCVRDFTAELAVQVVSKIGIDRAIKLDYTHDSDTAWINEKAIDRLEKFLDDMEGFLRTGIPLPAFGCFGGTTGVLAGDIVDEDIDLFRHSR